MVEAYSTRDLLQLFIHNSQLEADHREADRRADIEKVEKMGKGSATEAARQRQPPRRGAKTSFLR